MKTVTRWVRRKLPDKLHNEIQYIWKHRRLRKRGAAKGFSDLIVDKKMSDAARIHELAPLVDKYAVREFVRKRLSEDYLIPIIGIYENPDEIDPTDLPHAFVIKATHGSDMNIIVRDQARADWSAIRRTTTQWLQTEFWRLAREMPYKGVKPRLMLETYMHDESGNPPVDYKFYVFSGVVRMLHIDYGRWSEHTQAFFLPDGTPLRVSRGRQAPRPLPPVSPRLPDMVRDAAILGAGHEFIRVDLYDVGDRTYFSEMTLYPAAGLGRFEPAEFEDEMGAVWIENREVSRLWIS